MCLLLLEQSKSYETPSIKNEYSSCIRSMRFRYLKRIFIIGTETIIIHSSTRCLFILGQWLPTLSKIQFDDIYSHHERYVGEFDCRKQLFICKYLD